jgi:hypothetical protein
MTLSYRGLPPLRSLRRSAEPTPNDSNNELTPAESRRLTPRDDGPVLTPEQRTATARAIVRAGMIARNELPADDDAGCSHDRPPPTVKAASLLRGHTTAAVPPGGRNRAAQLYLWSVRLRRSQQDEVNN